MNPEHQSTRPPGQGPFRTTHWSQVLAATGSDTTQAQAALEDLCRLYWQPLYYYVRRRGYGVQDAQDLTQAFFAKLLERHWLASAEPHKGRFRTFLLTALERFLANEWDKARTLKRGGGQHPVPIQIDSHATRYGVNPQDPRTPEQIFEYQWAVSLLDSVLAKLENEFNTRHQQLMFGKLKSCLVGERTAQPYAALAAELGMTESAVKVTVHRLRQRYRELLRSEIAQTVASESEIEAEMKCLLEVLVRGRP